MNHFFHVTVDKKDFIYFKETLKGTWMFIVCVKALCICSFLICKRHALYLYKSQMLSINFSHLNRSRTGDLLNQSEQLTEAHWIFMSINSCPIECVLKSAELNGWLLYFERVAWLNSHLFARPSWELDLLNAAYQSLLKKKIKKKTNEITKINMKPKTLKIKVIKNMNKTIIN